MTTKNIEWLIGRLRAFSGTSLAPALMHQAADTLQSQAERVKALELDLDVQAGSIEAVRAVNARQAERIKELEEGIVGWREDQKENIGVAFDLQREVNKITSERDELRAQLAALRAALANAEPTQSKPVAYITDTHQGPMVWTPEMYGEACTYCDDGEFPVPLYAAAPAPQAQDKSDNYLSGYCTGRTDLLKEQSAQPVAQYDKTEMNAFVQDLYDQKMQQGKHGHYETMFHVVHKAIARVGIREVK